MTADARQVLASMGVDPAIRAQFASMGPEGEAFLLALLMQVGPPPARKPDPNLSPNPYHSLKIQPAPT